MVRFFKKNQIHILLVVILLLLVYNAWHLLPQLIIRSDGFMYMHEKVYQTFFSLPLFFTGFETSAMIAGFILPKFFGVNMPLYYWTVLLVMMLIDILLYIALYFVTKKRLVAFSGALFFAVSYFGNWDMVTTHCYCFFLERVIPTVLLIPSFLFLHLFLEKNNKKYYYISLLFYFFGVGIGHFTVLFTPLYLLYPIFWFLFEKKKNIERIRGIFYGLSYGLLSGFFILIQQINESGLGPKKWTFVEFFLHPEKFLYFKKIALQFVYWSQYPEILKNFAGNSLQTFINPQEAEFVIFPYLLSYIVASVIIYRFLPKQRPMLFTTVFGTAIIFYLNAYFNQYEMLNYSGASRYLYFSTFLLSIFWSYFLWAVFWRRKRLFMIVIGMLFVAVYYVINWWLIAGNFTQVLGEDYPTGKIFDYVISTRERLLLHTLVVVTYPEFGSQESTFFTEQIGKGEVKYLSDFNIVNPVRWEKVASSSAHVVKLRYDEECDCIAEEKIK